MGIQHTRRSLLATSIATAALVGGIGLYGTSQAGILDFLGHGDSPNTPGGAPASVAAVPGRAAPASADVAPARMPNYRSIVRRWGPAVVGITVDGTRKTGWQGSGGSGSADDPFYQFFHGLPGFEFRAPKTLEQPFHGQGSGFIISSDGLILTNAHVVRDAHDVTVKLADRRELKAKVLGTDPATDIAVLRAEATGLPTVRLGDPQTLQVGDYVLAIGAPFGFDQSATAGIVSAKGRALPGDAFVPFIQTDAAVNPGNSGGPLFDADGNVVGINAQIYSQTGGYQGLSFAIPVDVALQAKDQIVATGHASHARLGVLVQDLNQGLAESFGLSRPDGALVSSVDPESPAAAAGLKSGDVITQVDAVPIEKSGDLSHYIGMHTPGTRVALQVWRDHSSRTIGVGLGKADADNAPTASTGSGEHGKLGLALRPLTREERNAAGLTQGLVVEEVSGAAARAGMQPGDVVLGINGLPVRSIEQVQGVVREHPKSVALLIERDGQKIFVPVQLG